MVKVFKLWLRHIFSLAVLHIIIGNFNRLFNKKRYLYDSRYKICKTCLHKETITYIGEICGMCGCPLKSKLRVEDERCELNKWN
nr:MAG TPA: zinc-ribbon containing domain protein [Caudoviricetes sp.]